MRAYDGIWNLGMLLNVWGDRIWGDMKAWHAIKRMGGYENMLCPVYMHIYHI